MKCLLGQRQSWVDEKLERKSVASPGAHRVDARLRVRVSGVKAVAARDQDVFVAIQIDVQENRTPGPTCGVQAAGLADLGIASIAAVDENRVAFYLGPLLPETNTRSLYTHPGGLRNASEVFRAEHVQHNKVVESIAINIGEINAH